MGFATRSSGETPCAGYLAPKQLWSLPRGVASCIVGLPSRRRMNPRATQVNIVPLRACWSTYMVGRTLSGVTNSGLPLRMESYR